MAPSDSPVPPKSSIPELRVATPHTPPTHQPGGPKASAPGAFRSVSLEGLKAYLLKNFEQTFVLLTLVATVLINYFIPQKIAFLNFYFLPIILAGYYLGRAKAVLGAVFSFLLMLLYVYLRPEAFLTAQDGLAEEPLIALYLQVVIWGSFLVLSGAVVGGLHEKLALEFETSRRQNAVLQKQQDELNVVNQALKASAENLAFLNQELQRRQEELNHAHAALKDYSENLEGKVRERTEELNRAHVKLKDYTDNLEYKVKERTEELEKSKHSIESLKTKVEEALYSTMDSSVVKLIIEGRLRNEKRNVSVLFSDLVGFTSHSEQNPPEIVVRDLNRYIGDMEPILLAYRGHIDRYMGDGIMCEFGAPLDFETYRILSVLAAIKMQEKMVKVNYPWEMRIGVCSGSTITGLVGSKRQSYTAIGDVVNIASRLQNACTPGKVLIDRFTYESVSLFIDARKKRDLPAKEGLETNKERQLEALHEEVMSEPNNASHHFLIGQIHLELNEPVEALQYFERALQLDPNEMKFKLAYAEAGLKLRASEKINIKGRRQRIEAYEVIGVKDPFADPKKVSQGFAHEYQYVQNLIQIPSDVILPVEALDGSIGHSKMVAIFAYALATYFNLPDKDKLNILHAGFLADIGKEIVPHHLLNRMGSLSSWELDMVKMHPIEGARTLRKMGYDNEELINIVYHSHENYNGTGYPDGLKGEDIPLGSRIVAVADAYDALISWRPYRDPWERHVALDEIARGVSKGIYDPKIADGLIKIMAR
jgi:HD-GYP domain-containing protein (c-di-GMP phosphodiesterase class II)